MIIFIHNDDPITFYVCILQSNVSSKLVPFDTLVLCSTKMGLNLNNFHLPCHIHLYRLRRVKLYGDL